MAEKDIPQLITAGVIARDVGEPLHRVLWVLLTRKHIKAVARAGTLRLFSISAVAQVRDELSAMDRRRYRIPKSDPQSFDGVSQVNKKRATR